MRVMQSASNASSLPSRVERVRDRPLPPTWVSPMKICGTVRAIGARASISSRFAPPMVTSCSVYATPLLSSRRLARKQ